MTASIGGFFQVPSRPTLPASSLPRALSHGRRLPVPPSRSRPCVCGRRRARAPASSRRGAGERGTVRILDWKTGRPAEGDRFQLEIYAFYARDHWGVDPRSTTAADVYLLSGEVAEVQVSDEALESALERIEGSIGEMKAVHFDADGSKGDPGDFPMVSEDRASFECSGCNFRELCDRA
mgnify:CR=1 FL=1